MKRILVALISVLVLAAAGNVLAQTDPQQYESTPQQGTTASDTTSQPGTLDSTSGSTADPSNTPTEPQDSPANSATANEAPTQGLPATASNLPLVLVIGMSALGGVVALRLYRLRGAH